MTPSYTLVQRVQKWKLAVALLQSFKDTKTDSSSISGTPNFNNCIINERIHRFRQRSVIGIKVKVSFQLAQSLQ